MVLIWKTTPMMMAEAFEELGIQGFCSDFGSDYTCMEVL